MNKKHKIFWKCFVPICLAASTVIASTVTLTSCSYSNWNISDPIPNQPIANKPWKPEFNINNLSEVKAMYQSQLNSLVDKYNKAFCLTKESNPNVVFTWKEFQTYFPNGLDKPLANNNLDNEINFSYQEFEKYLKDDNANVLNLLYLGVWETNNLILELLYYQVAIMALEFNQFVLKNCGEFSSTYGLLPSVVAKQNYGIVLTNQLVNLNQKQLGLLQKQYLLFAEREFSKEWNDASKGINITTGFNRIWNTIKLVLKKNKTMMNTNIPKSFQDDWKTSKKITFWNFYNNNDSLQEETKLKKMTDGYQTMERLSINLNNIFDILKIINQKNNNSSN